MDTFADKIGIVTGAASGIGRALCEEMARRFAHVIMADLNGPVLQEAVESVTRAGGRARSVTLDVTDFAQVKRMADDAVAEHGRLDYVFNNAGIGILGEVQNFSYEDWRRVIDANLYGVVNGVAAVYPIMVKQGFGHIINTASLAGLIPVPGEISYTASKYGVVGLSTALRIEAADLGVRVSVVCPGLVETPILYTSKMIQVDREKVYAAMPKAMECRECARKILRGVERNRAIILVTAMARSFWILQRISPALVRWIWRRNMRELRAMRSA
ncbi:MAG: SDR family oxidoreductase [candidate division NC10 bacterium]|nr:SDR family oxidoreductase [candidate division NC10 bacterium]